MITSLVGDKKYGLSYSELREGYNRFIEMSDTEFLSKAAEAAHLACIICWFKEIGPDYTIGDNGIVHELIHLLAIPDEPLVNLKDIRKQFKETLYLAP